MNRLFAVPRPRLGAVVAALALFLGCTAAALAHPMGNFSINHYASLAPAGPNLTLRYRLDLAEIATAQEMSDLDLDGDGKVSDAERLAYLRAKVPGLLAGLDMRIDGQRVPLELTGSDLQIRPGAANLPTLLITIDCRTPLAPGVGASARRVIVYHDGNYAERMGWREITARAGAGWRIVQSDVTSAQRSDGLLNYPPNPTEAPPQERDARLVVAPSNAPAPAAASTPAPPDTSNASSAPRGGTPRDRFTALIATAALTPSAMAFSLAAALVLGAFHALAPGHGKTVVAAYLVGARGTPRHALLLGLVVTTTHVIGVFALGVIVLAASKYVVPERLYPWLGYASGLMIAAIGVWQLGRRYADLWLQGRPAGAGGAIDGGEHGAGGHAHEMPDRLTPAGLIALGVSGGILPCPSALIVMLAAISMHRIALGLELIVAFSFGMASVLIAIGLAMLYARRLAGRLQWTGWASRRARLVSPIVVAALGAVIAAQSLRDAGVLRAAPPGKQSSDHLAAAS